MFAKCSAFSGPDGTEMMCAAGSQMKDESSSGEVTLTNMYRDIGKALRAGNNSGALLKKIEALTRAHHKGC
jgi:hypothetical protein